MKRFLKFAVLFLSALRGAVMPLHSQTGKIPYKSFFDL